MAIQKVVVDGSSVTAPQLSDLFRQIGDGSLAGHHIQALLEHRNPFEIPMDTASQLNRWRRLLKGAFGIDLGEVAIPERKPGFDRLIVVPKGLTMARIIEVFRAEFKVYLYTEDLDGATSHERCGATYAIWVKDVIEADSDLANKSANRIKDENLTTETLPERLLHELVYYSERKEHLDVENVTLCAGSRDSDGCVPRVCWRPDGRGLCVGWHRPDGAVSFLRARAVVS